MRVAMLGTMIVVGLGTSLAWSQSPAVRPLPAPPTSSAALPKPPVLQASAEELPPLLLEDSAEAQLPNGTAVSRPLQPVIDAPAAASPPTDILTRPLDAPPPPLTESWYSLETVLWWPAGQAVPPLVTSNRGLSRPVLGEPGTITEVGGSQDTPMTVGGRFTIGRSLKQNRKLGVEASYMFLGSSNVWETNRAPGDRLATLGRPLVQAGTGQEDVFVIGSAAASAYVKTTASTRVAGWQVTGLSALYTQPWLRFTALAGYRYLLVNEGLRLDQATIDVPPPLDYLAAAANTQLSHMSHWPRTTLATDQFDTRNRFHGGQLGFRAAFGGEALYAEVEARVALGGTVQDVYVSGQSLLVPHGPFGAPTSGYGVLAQPTNIGRQTRTAFAVLPEGNVRLGYRMSGGTRLFVGYNFLYLSDTVRPGDQIDRTLGVNGGAWPSSVGERPASLLVSSDFWIQGLTLGLEVRY